MKINGYRVALAALALILLTPTALAEDGRVDVLERTLVERDRVIRELLERVEALERRIGIEPSSRASSEEVASGGASQTAERGAGSETGHPPGRIVVDEFDAERALDRALTRQGALLLPSGALEWEPSFDYSRREGSTPTIVSSAGTLFAGKIDSSSDNLTARLALRLGLPLDSQLEIELPYQWRDLADVTSVGLTPTSAASEAGSGPGDLRVGFAKTLLREGLGKPDLIARVVWDTGSGRSHDGGVPLGGGFQAYEGSLTAIKRRDPVAFIGGLSYAHALEEEEVQPGATVAAQLRGLVALSPETSLTLGFSAAHQRETRVNGVMFEGSDRTIGTLLLGGSTLLAPGTLLNLSLGIGLTADADDFSLSVALPLRRRKPLF